VEFRAVVVGPRLLDGDEERRAGRSTMDETTIRSIDRDDG
jgi:hypothetical protein